MRFERPNSRRICMASRTHCSRVPRVYLGWANPVFLAFFAFNRINNLRIFSVALSSIPTAPTNHLPDGWILSKFSRGQKGADKANDPVLVR